MPELLQPRTDLPSPFASRVVQSRFVSLEEAERNAVGAYYGSMTRRTLGAALVALFFLFWMGYAAVNARNIAMDMQFRVGGGVVLAVCAAGLAYLGYEYHRKQRIFLLADSFAIERRFSGEVELIA